jgi:hypothetical protein
MMSVGSSSGITISHDQREDASLVSITDRGEKEIWDFVIAVPAIEEPLQYKVERRRALLEDLTKVGLIVQRVESRDSRTYFLLIRASEERLEEQAELLGTPLELKDEFNGGACPFTIAKRELFKHRDGMLFSKTQRQFLINSIITSDDEDGGAEIDLERLQYDGIIDKAYPLHENKVKDAIITEWVMNRSLRSVYNMPNSALQKYFGEEIAFYYGFLAFYTRWLVVASIVGTVFFVTGVASFMATDGKENKWTNSVYSVFIAIWVTLFLEFWKREKNVLAFKWHMLNFEEVEGVRPGFIGDDKHGVYSKGEFVELRPDEIYGIKPPKLTRFAPKEKTRIRMLSGFGVIAMLGCVVVIATMSVLTLRLLMQNSQDYWTEQFASVVGGILNALVIQIMNKVYRTVAVKMNEWENHRTVTEFHNNLLFKIFLFQFVNSYTSLYYIAFFKKHTFMWGNYRLHDSCGDDDDDVNSLGYGCPDQLRLQLIMLLGLNIVVGQLQEVVIPFALSKAKMWWYVRQNRVIEKDLPKHEREYQLNQHEGTFDEYSEMIIQYGYITLFAAAFPLAPLLAVVNNYIEMRSDTWKWLTSYNKPVPRGADDIGGWYTIMEVLAVFSVITNCLLIAYSFPTLHSFFTDPYYIIVFVVILEHIIFLIKYLIAMFVPDVPADIRKILAKEYYVQQQIIKKYERREHHHGRGRGQTRPQSDSEPSSPVPTREGETQGEEI